MVACLSSHLIFLPFDSSLHTMPPIDFNDYQGGDPDNDLADCVIIKVYKCLTLLLLNKLVLTGVIGFLV